MLVVKFWQWHAALLRRLFASTDGTGEIDIGVPDYEHDDNDNSGTDRQERRMAPDSLLTRPGLLAGHLACLYCVYIHTVARTNLYKSVVLGGCGKLWGAISYFLATRSSQTNEEAANDVDPKYYQNPHYIVSMQVRVCLRNICLVVR